MSCHSISTFIKSIEEVFLRQASDMLYNISRISLIRFFFSPIILHQNIHKYAVKHMFYEILILNFLGYTKPVLYKDVCNCYIGLKDCGHVIKFHTTCTRTRSNQTNLTTTSISQLTKSISIYSRSKINNNSTGK